MVLYETEVPVPSDSVDEVMDLLPGTQSDSISLAALNCRSLMVFSIVLIFCATYAAISVSLSSAPFTSLS